jgi:hypothetical protein
MPVFDVQPLTEEETNQLRNLLIRYATYHAGGLANNVIDALIANFRRSPKLIEADASVAGQAAVPAPKKRKSKVARI